MMMLFLVLFMFFCLLVAIFIIVLIVVNVAVVVVLVIGFSVHYWEHQQGNVHLSWMVAALAVFMVLAMWIFPEAGGKNEKKGPTK